MPLSIPVFLYYEGLGVHLNCDNSNQICCLSSAFFCFQVSGVYFNVVAAASLFRPLSFWASQGEEGIALQERCTLDKNQQNQSREDVSAPASAHNGPTIGDSEGRSNKHTLVEETGAAEENGRCEMDSPVSPLVSTSADGDFPSKPQKSLPGNVAMHPAHMGSVSSLPQSVYGSSMLFDPHGLEAEQMEEVEDQYEEVATNGLVQKLASMFDFSVMKSYVAVFIAVFSFLSFFGYFNFVLFLPATVMARGIDKYDKAILVSVCGIGDLLGRLTTAAIGDRNFITRYKLQAMGTFACGINIGGFLLARSFGWMISHAALYGFFGGIYVSLAAVVIIDFVGLTKMPKLLAVVMLIQGVGASVGQPLLGKKNKNQLWIYFMSVTVTWSFNFVLTPMPSHAPHARTHALIHAHVNACAQTFSLTLSNTHICPCDTLLHAARALAVVTDG